MFVLEKTGGVGRVVRLGYKFDFRRRGGEEEGLVGGKYFRLLRNLVKFW